MLGHIVQVVEQHRQQPEALAKSPFIWPHSKATALGLFKTWAIVTAKYVFFTIQRGPKSVRYFLWLSEGMDIAISSLWKRYLSTYAHNWTQHFY